MAKALFLGVPLHGHVRPSRDLVAALVRRGEGVRYYAGRGFEELIAATGAEPASYGTPLVEALRTRVDELPRLPRIMMEATAAVLDGDLEAFRGWSPDYVITDLLAPWGYWVAQVLQVPVVTSRPTFAVNRRVLAEAVRSGIRPTASRDVMAKLGAVWHARTIRRALARRYGVEGVGASAILFPPAERHVIYTTRAFQPHGDTFDATQCVFAGPSLLGDAGAQLSERDAGRVYLSLGTLFQGDGGVLSQCVRALADASWRVVATRGGSRVRAADAANVEWLDFADQRDELRRASVFITHAGLGGVHEALLAGVPMLLVPQMSEQAMVATRVAELGAGIALGVRDLTHEAIRNAVQRLMVDPAFRDAASQLGASLRRDAASDMAADTVIRFVSGRA